MEKIMIDRSRAIALGREAAQISAQGSYTTPLGKKVEIAADVAYAVRETKEYRPELPIGHRPTGGNTTEFSVVNQTTLEAARTLLARGMEVAALNFASAKNPGGGFLSGGRAQEESLCRSSSLYECLKNCQMYPFHKSRRDGMYTSWVIYSPDVPVFRDDDGNLLEDPYKLSFITCPAVNAGTLKPNQTQDISSAMRERVDRVLTVASLHGCDALVLGAWGCGVFRNDPEQIASLFHSALHGQFAGAFKAITFAIIDGWADHRNIGPFERLFPKP